MHARAILLAFLFIATSAYACGPAQPAVDPSSEAKEDKPKREKVVDKDAVSGQGKQWGGWRWKGKRDQCYFVSNNQCFETKAEACKSAKCGKKGCNAKSGAPTKVSCRK